MGFITSFVKEFKEFAVKGNAVDLAVGVVIGAAFGGVVTSLVNDVIMPPLGLLIGGVDFKDKKIVLQPLLPGAAGQPPVDLRYGMFLNTLINFVIVALAIFVVIKLMSLLHRKEAALPDPPLTTDQQLLTEIRDLLKARASVEK